MCSLDLVPIMMPEDWQWSMLIGQHTMLKDSLVEGTENTLQSWWYRMYAKIVYDARPNTTSKETRQEQWEKLHNPYRYLYSLLLYVGPPGYFLYNLRAPMILVSFIIVANAVYTTMFDLFYEKHESMPTFGSTEAWGMFRMGSFALSLVLSVKLSKVYDRFWSARENFGKIRGLLNMIMQLMVLYCKTNAVKEMPKEEVDILLDTLSTWCTVFPYAVTMQLLSLTQVPVEVIPLLQYEEIELLQSTAKPRKFVLMKIQSIVHTFDLSTCQYLSIQKLIQECEIAAATCRRIKFTALPYNISQVCTGFVMIWLCIIPFGMQETNSNTTESHSEKIISIWIEAMIIFLFSLMMLCVDEVANQLEDPFHSLPLFDSLKTAMSHLATVREDYEKLDIAARVVSKADDRI